MINKKVALEAEIKAFEMYKKDLEKIRTKIVAKREKEILTLSTKIKNIEELDEDELQSLYGNDGISKREYEKRLKNLKKYEENKATFKDNPTALKLYLDLLDKEIKQITLELWVNGEDLKEV